MFKLESWFVFSLLAVLFWGVWGILPKFALSSINPKSVLIYEILGSIPILLLTLYLVDFKPQFSTTGFIFAFFTGVAGLLGALFFLYALSKGRAPVVITMTALYPIITIFLAFIIFQEPITLKQGFGIFFAVVAMLLFAL